MSDDRLTRLTPSVGERDHVQGPATAVDERSAPGADPNDRNRARILLIDRSKAG
jgi:hypothetical protein